jgi:hypothetical protein
MGSLVAKWVTGGYRGALPIPPRSDGFDMATLPGPDDAQRTGDHFILDANFVWRESEHTSLELMVRNVFDDAYKLPQGGVPYVPMPRRSLHLTLDYRW